MRDPFIPRRIEFVRAKVRMTQLMDHFGHRYRLHGNMKCPFHDDTNPSARLYADQDTFWCWTCSPDHGVDIIEYVILELSLVEEVRGNRKLSKEKLHSLATFKALEYLESEFSVGYLSEPWEQRLVDALRKELPPEDPRKYWRRSNLYVLRLLSGDREMLKVYSEFMLQLTPMKNAPIATQRPYWLRMREGLHGVGPAPSA